jgi:CRISPR-associated protein Cas1
MLKRTLYFGNPAYLNLKDGQLVITFPNDQGMAELTGKNKVPVEDIGIVLLDHRQITITHGLLNALLANNAAIITCDDAHLPSGLLLPLAGHSAQTERIKAQTEASLPLKKQLWAQTVTAKLQNQAKAAAKWGINTEPLLHWASKVRSGDPDNFEARGAAYYWKNYLPPEFSFFRSREGVYPNALLNYGYAIVRAIVARALVSSGLLPTLGIFHSNKYNAYCLADDIMEPYRPFVDITIRDMVLSAHPNEMELNNTTKMVLLALPTHDIAISNEKSPLMVAASRTTASLARCFLGEEKKLAYPEFLA